MELRQRNVSRDIDDSKSRIRRNMLKDVKGDWLHDKVLCFHFLYSFFLFHSNLKVIVLYGWDESLQLFYLKTSDYKRRTYGT